MNVPEKCNPIDCNLEIDKIKKKIVELEGFMILMIMILGPMFIMFMSSLGRK